MVRVLASPGTPSHHRCPPHSTATTPPSSTPSCPTITRLISNNAASRAVDGLEGSATPRRRGSFSVIWSPCAKAACCRSGKPGATAQREGGGGGRQEQPGGGKRARPLALLEAEADAGAEAVVHRAEVLAGRRLEEAAVGGLGAPGPATGCGRPG